MLDYPIDEPEKNVPPTRKKVLTCSNCLHCKVNESQLTIRCDAGMWKCWDGNGERVLKLHRIADFRGYIVDRKKVKVLYLRDRYIFRYAERCDLIGLYVSTDEDV